MAAAASGTETRRAAENTGVLADLFRQEAEKRHCWSFGYADLLGFHVGLVV